LTNPAPEDTSMEKKVVERPQPELHEVAAPWAAALP
jgi:hypothetical protein